MLERDNAIEIVEIAEELKDRVSKQYSCPTCKKILPKAVYMQARKPKYCLWCGQALKYPKRNLVEDLQKLGWL